MNRYKISFLALCLAQSIYPVDTKVSTFSLFSPPKDNVFAYYIQNNTAGTLAYENETKAFYDQKRAFLNNTIWMGKTFQSVVNNNHYMNGPFLFGVSSSHYQIEGGYDSIMFKHHFTTQTVPANASERFYKNNIDPKTNEFYERPGMAVNFWNNYKTMIPQMKQELGINSFRLSIGWSRVVPDASCQVTETGWIVYKDNTISGFVQHIDKQAVETYIDIIKTLKDNDIEPIVVFNHYTVPSWFEDFGGFEKEENIDCYVEFCLYMYKQLHEYVTYWSTYNAIEGYAFKGYFRGEGSPGIKNNIGLTETVMKNMLEAHVRIYQAIHTEYKKLAQEKPGIPKPMVGIQKNVIPMDPAFFGKWRFTYPANILTAHLANIIQDKGFYQFFTTGEFNVKVLLPGKGLANVYHKNTKAPYSLDWIGINHYSNMYMGAFTQAGEPNPDRITNNSNYRYYPEGLYRAIVEISSKIAEPVGKLKNSNKAPLPIIITENGIAAKDDAMRKRFYQETLFTIMHAIHDGYNVQGYLPWSSHDNYEWKTKKGTKRYGFFKVDFTDEQNPTVEKNLSLESSIYYATVLKNFFNL